MTKHLHRDLSTTNQKNRPFGLLLVIPLGFVIFYPVIPLGFVIFYTIIPLGFVIFCTIIPLGFVIFNG